MLMPETHELLGPAHALSEEWTGQPVPIPPPEIPKPPRVTFEDGQPPAEEGVFPPGARVRCSVPVVSPTGEDLQVEWDLRVDASDNHATGGAYEPPTAPIEGAVLQAAGAEALIALPSEPRAYRVFVAAYDSHSNAATANTPLLVSAPTP